MKKIIRFIVCLAILTLSLAASAFGAEYFVIPSAGAETVLRDIPTTYVYSSDWQASLGRSASLPAEEDTAGGLDNETPLDDAAAESADEANADTPGAEENVLETAEAAEGTETEEGNTGNTESTAAESTAAAAPVATNNRVVCIDAGHQSKGNNAQEPIGPGASETKAKVAGGTTGVATGVPEYKLTLDVALKLQSELQSRGYTVVMCRTSNDVNISNAERAEIANNAGAGAFLRLHGNGAGSSSVAGAETLAPSSSNPYCSGIAAHSQALSKAVLNGLCAATGAKNRGVKIADNMSGINWSRVPVTIVEMGYMTNPAEDASMQDPSYQAKLAKGMADGVDAYFGL